MRWQTYRGWFVGSLYHGLSLFCSLFWAIVPPTTSLETGLSFPATIYYFLAREIFYFRRLIPCKGRPIEFLSTASFSPLFLIEIKNFSLSNFQIGFSQVVNKIFISRKLLNQETPPKNQACSFYWKATLFPMNQTPKSHPIE